VLFDLCSNKDVTVYDFLRRDGQLTFIRWLPPFLFDQWLNLVNSAFSYHFENNSDIVKWNWNSKGIFTTKSVYDHLSNGHPRRNFKHIWKSKLPYKIKIFTWLLENKVILTKDNLVRRKWTRDPTCSFCSQNESVDHLFFLCPIVKVNWGFIAMCLGARELPGSISGYHGWIKNHLPNGGAVHHFLLAAVSWAIWKCRNKACFDSKTIKHPVEIIYHACSFMSYWAGLYPPEMQGKILEGVKALLACVHRAVAVQSDNVPRILPAVTEDEKENLL